MAKISVNGASEDVSVGGTFPIADPVFKLVSLDIEDREDRRLRRLPLHRERHRDPHEGQEGHAHEHRRRHPLRASPSLGLLTSHGPVPTSHVGGSDPRTGPDKPWRRVRPSDRSRQAMAEGPTLSLEGGPRLRPGPAAGAKAVSPRSRSAPIRGFVGAGPRRSVGDKRPGSAAAARHPSFWRSTSECAFAVRGEIPSRTPTSSFEQPAAMSSTTSRCRSVIFKARPLSTCVMPSS